MNLTPNYVDKFLMQREIEKNYTKAINKSLDLKMKDVFKGSRKENFENEDVEENY